MYPPHFLVLRSLLILSCYLRLCFFHLYKFLHASYIPQFHYVFWCGSLMQLKVLFRQNEVFSSWKHYEKLWNCTYTWPGRRKGRTNGIRKSFELISELSFEPETIWNEAWSRRSIPLNVGLCGLHILYIHTVYAVHTWLWLVYVLQISGVVASVKFIHPPILCVSRALTPE
jgi:hypothetical protein